MQKLDDDFRKFLGFLISQINKKSIKVTSRKQLDPPVHFTNLLMEPEWERKRGEREKRVRKKLSNYPGLHLPSRFKKLKPPPFLGVRGNYCDYLSENLGDLPQLESLFLYSFNNGKDVTVALLKSRLSNLFFFGFKDHKEQIIKLVVQSWGEAMEETRIAAPTDEGFQRKNLTETVPAVVNALINEGVIRVPEEGMNKESAIFPSPAGLRFGEVRWVFVSDDTARISTRGQERIYHFGELNFRDNRTVGSPNALWSLLRVFAKNQGEIDYDTTNIEFKAQNRMKNHVKNIRKKLKDIFGIEEDPFEPYKKTRSYKLKMAISDKTRD